MDKLIIILIYFFLKRALKNVKIILQLKKLSAIVNNLKLLFLIFLVAKMTYEAKILLKVLFLEEKLAKLFTPRSKFEDSIYYFFLLFLALIKNSILKISHPVAIILQNPFFPSKFIIFKLRAELTKYFSHPYDYHLIYFL